MRNKPVVVGIHQPNYFPWLGFFYKVSKSQSFIFLDGVAYPKSGNSMSCVCNRVTIMSPNQKSIYLSCPVERKSGVQIIDTVIMKNDHHQKNLKNLEKTYIKHRFFEETFNFIDDLYKRIEERKMCSLSIFNIDFIKSLSRTLGLGTIFYTQSQLGIIGQSTHLLVELVLSVGGTDYLAGQGGSKKYLDLDIIKRSGLAVNFIHYPNFRYPQHGTSQFIPGLSIIDALMNVGFDNVRKILNEN